MRSLNGIIPALLTPFDEQGQLDEAGLEALTDYVIKKGADAIYVNGSTAESFLCDVSTRERVLKRVAKAAGGRVPLIAQIGSLVYEDSQLLIETASQAGYEYLSAVTPFYYQFSFEEVLAYYKKLSYSGIPLVVYMIPALTKVQLDISQIERLFALKDIVGMKFTSGDIFLLERLKSRFPDKKMFFGYDEMLFSGIFLGSEGAIGSTFNITLPLAKKIWKDMKEGRMEEARKGQHELNEFITEALKAGLYPFLKGVLKNLGVPAGFCRHPFAPLSKEGEAAAAEQAEKIRRWDGN